jgi:hypothetical protein
VYDEPELFETTKACLSVERAVQDHIGDDGVPTSAAMSFRLK